MWDRAAFLPKVRKDAIVDESVDLLLVDSGLPNPDFNTIGKSSLHPRFGAERIEKAMEEVAQVPVEERLHIETLRLLMENAKLRKNLNGLSSLSRSSPLLVAFRAVYAAYLPLRVVGAIL